MNNTSFTVEANIPIPTTRKRVGRNSKYPFRQLRIGDSFFVGGPRKLFRLAHAHYKPLRFVTRSCNHKGVRGFRVWRIK